MTQQEDIQKIKDLVQKDEIEKALNALDDLLQDHDSLKEILFQRGRFADLLRRDRLGVISYDESNLERNKIRQSIIELISEWENKQLPKSNPQRIGEFYSQNKTFILGLALVTTLAIVGFFVVDGLRKGNDFDKTQYVQLGNEKFEQGDWVNAIFYFDALVESDPENVDYLERRGYCNFGLARYELALKDFNKAIGLTKVEESPQLLFFRGNTYKKQQNYELAIDDYNAMLEIRPNHMGATNQRGLAYIGIGQVQDACKDFERVFRFGIQELKRTAKVNLDRYCN